MLPFLLLATADPVLEDYAKTAVGEFTSVAQHAADPRYDIVEARIVRIWPERTDAVWLYQEQAIVNVSGQTTEQARAKPYFQFVGRIAPLGDGSFRRDNYRLKEPAKWVGLKAGDPRLSAISEADLAEPSCHNRIERVSAGHYTGRTESCTNRYKGAAMMRSISVATSDSYANWDRGFSVDGKLVWGPADGGYIFKRVK